MDDVIKLIYINFLLLNGHRSNITVHQQFIYGVVRDNYLIQDKLFNFINKYATNSDPRIWRIKLLAYSWAPGDDL